MCPMRRHAAPDELARLGADDLQSRKALKVSRHLARCPKCTELNNQLSAVPALLSSVHFPEMPASLVIRIDNVLATEAARRVAAEPATEAGRRELPIRGARDRTRPRLSRRRTVRAGWWLPVPATRVLATAATVIVVGFCGYLVASHIGVSRSASSASQAAASGPLSSQLSRGSSVTYRQDHSSRTIQSVTANTNFQPATLAGQALAALSQAKMEAPRPGSMESSGKIYSSMAPPTSTSHGANALGGQATASAGSAASQLAGCVDRVIKPGQVVLLVELAKFEGKPATIVVTAPASVSQASPPKGADIWALGDACSATTSDVLDHVKVAHL
jgi:hypothetical protein